MKKTGELLVTIVKNYFTGSPMPEGADYAAAFRLAKMHAMGNFFYEAVKDSPVVSDEVKAAAKQHFLSNFAQQTAQEYYAAELFERLEEKQIPYVPLKGYILRRMYPAPELRTSCDLDVFYDKTRTKDVREILRGMGFKEGGVGDNHIDWSLDTVTIEMHHELAADNDVYHGYFKNAFDRLSAKEGTARRDFSPEDFYVYFLTHSAKHFSGAGFGIRTVLDIWIYRQKTALDEEYLTQELEKVRLLKFRKAIEDLAECWFGNKEKTEDLELLGEYVLTSGTYGKRATADAIKNSGSGAKVAKIRFMRKKIFPSYKYMKGMYPIVGKLPFLLPFAWVVRWFAVLFKRRKNVGQTIDSMKRLDDENVAKVEKIMSIVETPIKKE